MKKYIFIPLLLLLTTFMYSAENSDIEDSVETFFDSGNYIKIADYDDPSDYSTDTCVVFINKQSVKNIKIGNEYDLEIYTTDGSYKFDINSTSYIISSDYDGNLIIEASDDYSVDYTGGLGDLLDIYGDEETKAAVDALNSEMDALNALGNLF